MKGTTSACASRRGAPAPLFLFLLALLFLFAVAPPEAAAMVDDEGTAGSGVALPGNGSIDVPPASTAPATSLSTSPVAPDGDSGWFMSPVTATLSAVDPEGSVCISFFQWGVDPPTTVYAGTFAAPSGTNTLYYRSLDAAGDVESVKSQMFNVDAVIVAPTVTAPTGAESAPSLVQGTVSVDATAADAVSGVNYVAFYYFGWTGAGWEPVGTQIGGDQTLPIPGSGYRVSWNTRLVPDGRYKIQAQLRDVAGNSAFSAPQYAVVDNVGPTVDLSEPRDESTVRGASVRILGTASDANLTSWELAVKPAPSDHWTTLARGSSSIDDSLLHVVDTTAYPDGRYELRLTAVDGIGNWSTDSHLTVAIDNTAPAVGTVEALSADTLDVAFLEAIDPASVAPGSFVIEGLTVSQATLLPGGTTVRLDTSVQAPGAPYTVAVKTTAPTVTDAAGNLVRSPASASFAGYDPTKDVTPPSRPGTPRASSGHGLNRVTWSPSLTPDVAGYNLYRDAAADGAFATKVNGGTLLRSTAYDDTDFGTVGYYYYRVTAVDATGNESTMSGASSNQFVGAEQTVGVGGGSLDASNGEVAIDVPNGALTASISLRIDEEAAAPSAPSITFVSSEYLIQPHGQVFASPVTITVKYSPGSVDESTIRLLYHDGRRWRQVEGPSVVDAAHDTVTGAVTHFSSFAAGSIDVTPPGAPTADPVDGTPDFPVRGFVVLTFPEDMDADSLTDDTVQIRVGDVGGTAFPVETVLSTSDMKSVYIYPGRMLDADQAYTVWVSGSVTDLAGNPMGADSTSAFTTAAGGGTPHDAYSTSSGLCRNCHTPADGAGPTRSAGSPEPTVLTETTEKQVCYVCHDGTGSSYNVKTGDGTDPPAWDFGESVIGTTTKRSYHPVPTRLSHVWVDGTGSDAGVTMRCSSCHNAHDSIDAGQRALAVKKLDPSFSGPYGPKSGNEFCWTCHNTTAVASGGYISAAAWNAGTGYDHKTYYPVGDASHNMLAGPAALVDVRVPSVEGPITCKGCHSEHGSSNDKLILESVKGLDVTFRARTDADYNTTYEGLCAACHAPSGVGGYSWTGLDAHNAAGHGSSPATMAQSYAPPVPAKSQTLRVGQCKQCHEPHGAGDANGAFPNLTRYFEDGVCYVCHGDTGNPPGARDLETVFGRRHSHDLGLSATASRRHDLEAEFATTPSGTGTATLSGAKRHVECTDCHNPHSSTNGLHARGSNAIVASGSSLAGVSGISPTEGAGWSEPSTWTWAAANSVYPATAEYQLCLKCHSAAAYGAAPPARERNTTPGEEYWNFTAYTDQAKEFNPNNASYHAVWGSSKASGQGTYRNGWSSTSRMYCSDCHRSSTSGDPIGSHGSSTPFMLGGNTTAGNARYEKGKGTYASPAERNAAFSFCFECHDPGFSNTGFSGAASSNLHIDFHGQRSCTTCHAAVPHGWRRDHLLVVQGDPAPYNDGSAVTSAYPDLGPGIRNDMTMGTPGGWVCESCHD